MMNPLSESSLTPEQVLMMIPRTLIVGYGNPDREDDGVAWHILRDVSKIFDIRTPTEINEGLFPEGRSLDFYLNLQLTPEMAEEMISYQRVCFVDAHTGSVPENINWQSIESRFQNSPLTHHFTPESLVSLLEHAYRHKPECVLLSVRGFQFRFKQQLSTETEELANQAVKRIVEWIIGPIT